MAWRSWHLSSILYRAAETIDGEFFEHVSHMIKKHRWKGDENLMFDEEVPGAKAESVEFACFAHVRDRSGHIHQCNNKRLKKGRNYCSIHNTTYNVLKEKKELSCKKAEEKYAVMFEFNTEAQTYENCRHLLRLIYECVELRIQIMHVFFRPGTSSERNAQGHHDAIDWFELVKLQRIMDRLNEPKVAPKTVHEKQKKGKARQTRCEREPDGSQVDDDIDPIVECWRMVRADIVEALRLRQLFESTVHSIRELAPLPPLSVRPVDDEMIADHFIDMESAIQHRGKGWDDKYGNGDDSQPSPYPRLSPSPPHSPSSLPPLRQLIVDGFGNNVFPCEWCLSSVVEDFVDTGTLKPSHVITKVYLIVRKGSFMLLGSWLAQKERPFFGGYGVKKLQGYAHMPVLQSFMEDADVSWPYPEKFPIGPFGEIGNVFVWSASQRGIERAVEKFKDSLKLWIAPDKSCTSKHLCHVLSGSECTLTFDRSRFFDCGVTIDSTKAFKGAQILNANEYVIPYMTICLSKMNLNERHKNLPFREHTEFQKLHA